MTDSTAKMDVESASDGKGKETEGISISMPVLTAIKDSQSQYGLRHGNYTRYRQYCCRRLRRLRKSVKFLHGRVHFKKKKLEAKNVKGDRHLSIPLLNAERAWSYAMQLKDDLSKEDDSRKQHHLLKRLGRAVKWSKMLQELTLEVGDTRTQIEAEAYASWMAGNEHMERMRWREALRSHLRSKTLCENLAKVSDIEAEERCNEMAAEMNATVRLCKYNVRKQIDKKQIDALVNESTIMDSELQAKFENMAEAYKKKANTSSSFTILWNGRKVPVTNQKICKILSEVEEKETAANNAIEQKEKIEALTAVVKEYTEATRLCQIDLVANEGAKLRTVNLDKKAGYLKMLRSFLNYCKLKNKFNRNQLQANSVRKTYDTENAPGVVLKGKSKKERVKESTLVGLYEKLLENVSEMKAFSEDSKNQKNLEEAKALGFSYRSLRCYFMGKEAETEDRHGDANALYKLATLLASRATGMHGSDTERAPLVAELKAVEEDLVGRKLRTYALALLQKESNEAKLANSVKKMQIDKRKAVPLLKRLGEFHANTDSNLADFPSKFKLAPGKPIFFDVAYHSLTYDDISKRVTEEGAKSGGLLSGFGLW